jgi:hypothetical protein
MGAHSWGISSFCITDNYVFPNAKEIVNKRASGTSQPSALSQNEKGD